eukprot:scaffold1896_cov121-Isochrysis_galbana.AAC.12
MADADAAKRLDAVTARVRAFAADAVARRSRTHAEAPQALRAPRYPASLGREVARLEPKMLESARCLFFYSESSASLVRKTPSQ